MIYLENNHDIQEVYIPRQDVNLTAFTRYATEQYVDNAIANETARTEETYAKIDDLSAYTETEDFATINGSAITHGGNIEIEGAVYSAGTNINIDANNVISVTGITVPTKLSDLENDEGFITTADTQNFVTSADVQTQIEGYNYINSGQAQTQIDNSISGKADTTALTQYYTSAQTDTAIDNAVSGKMDTSAMSAYTPTSGFSTINGSAITEGGNIEIEGAIYSAGTNINIDGNNVISVTGITVPTKTSNLQNDSGFITANDIPTSNTAFTNDAGYITTADTQNFVTSGDVKTQIEGYNYVNSGDVQSQINDSISGKVDTSAMTAYWTSAETENAISSATEDFVTSADVETQITNKGYITGYTETDPVFQASAASGITANDIQNWDSKLDSSALTPYYTSAQTDTAISNATSGLATEQYVDNSVSGKVDTSALTEYWTSAQTNSAITAATDDMATQTWVGQQGYLTGYTETDPVFQASAASGISAQDILDWDAKLDSSDLIPYYTSAQTDTAISNAVSGKADTDAFTAYTPTSGFSTINGSAITEGGNIVIQGGSGATYSAGANIDISAQNEISVTGITSYTGITSGDVTSALGYTPISGVDLSNYYTSAQTDTQISNATSTKQDTLVSGTNIKTINGMSLLGNGGIYITEGQYYYAGTGLNLNNNTFNVIDYDEIKGTSTRLDEVEETTARALNVLNLKIGDIETLLSNI